MSFLADLRRLGGVDLSSLGFLPRLLLVCDGTLTDTLEAAMLEPIGIRKLGDEVTTTTEPSGVTAELALAVGEEVMHREILLFGMHTGRPYVYARSTLAIGRLPRDFVRDLHTSGLPMGRLWREHRIETHKELLQAGCGEEGEFFGGISGQDLISRSYRLISGGRPVIVISETFPRSLSSECDFRGNK